MNGRMVQIIVTVPPHALEEVLAAIGAAGGGTVGEYTHCSFSHSGTGRFLPGDKANPQVGSRHTLNSQPEVRIETFCERARARAVLQAIRGAHPYEEPVIYVVPLLSEDAL